MRTAVVSSLFIVLVEGQWGLFNWQQQQQHQQGQAQPIQPQWTNNGLRQAQQQQQQNPLFQNFLNPFQQFTLFPTTTTTTAAPTTTTIRLEDIPNPDREQGNWPIPNPASWPSGPDWNDERNSWDGEFGWGGKDYNEFGSVSLVRNAEGLHRIGK